VAANTPVAAITGNRNVPPNRNVVNGSEPILTLIGGLPTGTPVALQAAYGRWCLVEVLEDSDSTHSWLAAAQDDRLGAPAE